MEPKFLADRIQGILLSEMPVEIKAERLNCAVLKIMREIKKVASIEEFTTLSQSTLQFEDRKLFDQLKIDFAPPSIAIEGREGVKDKCYCFPCQSGYCKELGLPCGKEVKP